MKVLPGQEIRFKSLVLLAFFAATARRAAGKEAASEPRESSSDSAPAASDTEKSSEGRLVHRSGESASKNAAWIQLELKIRSHPGFADYRNLATNSSGGTSPITFPENPQPKATASQLHLLESEFDFRMALAGYAQRGAFVNLVGALPFRYLSSNNKDDVQGSEFGGYEIGLEGSPVRHIVVRSTFADRQSSKFNLIDRHYESMTSLRYQGYETLGTYLSLGIKMGPQFIVAFGQTATAENRYGKTAGVMADAFADIRNGGYILARLGVGADMQRMLDYKALGIDQGGAGLLSVSPYLEVPVLDVIWVGVRVDLPAFRPAGREQAFGNLSQPGLFGKSVNFTLQAMNF